MDGKQRQLRGKTDFARRKGRGWVFRSGIALGCLVLGYYATVCSLANVIVKVDPARASALAPGNGMILARYAEEVFASTPSMDYNSLATKLSRRALKADPTAVEALTVLGFQAQLSGDKNRSDRIFSYSTSLSRRELRPRLWAIEKAVSRGDIFGALRNYDIALRTSSEAAKDLFPILVAALSEPRVRAGLLKILATRPVWADGFVAYAAHSEIEPEGVIALFREDHGAGLNVTDDQRVSLVNVLLAQNKFDRAWDYYRSFRVDARRDRSRDPNFALDSNKPSAFDWQAGNDTRLSAAILPQGEDGLLDFAIPPSMGGVLVKQTQLLPVGAYRLEGVSEGLNQPERSRPYWTLTCLDGRELGRVSMPNSDSNAARFSGRFIVPQDCTVQTLAMVARASDEVTGVAGQVLRAQLVPLQ